MDYRVINFIVNNDIDPKTHIFTSPTTRANLLHPMGTCMEIDLPRVVFQVIQRALDEGRITGTLPFGSMITQIHYDKVTGVLDSDPLMIPMRPTWMESVRLRDIRLILRRLWPGLTTWRASFKVQLLQILVHPVTPHRRGRREAIRHVRTTLPSTAPAVAFDNCVVISLTLGLLLSCTDLRHSLFGDRMDAVDEGMMR